MQINDTVKLLRECDAGSKMAVSSIDDIIDKISSERLRERVSYNKQQHSKIGNEIHSILSAYDIEDKEPTPIAKGMSWLKTNVKLGVDNSDSTVADLLTDGCNMGVKSLSRYLNQYKAADTNSKQICRNLIDLEQSLADDVREFL